MENKTIQPIHDNIQIEPNQSFTNERAQKLAQLANSPQVRISDVESDDFKKDVEYVKMKIAFFFFALIMIQFFILFFLLSFVLVGIPFLVFSILFYLDVRKRYKTAISKLK